MNAALRVLSVAVVTATALVACSPKPETRSSSDAPVRAVLTVAPSTVADLRPVAGEVTTRDLSEARARIGGTLTRLLVREGDAVRAGQVVALVQDDRIGLQTAAFDAAVAAAEAEAVRAEAELRRARTLYERGIYAAARLESSEAAAKAARGQADAARAQRRASAELADQGAILAPASGTVLSADVPAGSVVMPGQSVATITSGPVVVRVVLPESQARALRVGAAVTVAPDGPAGAERTGTVAQVYPALDAGRVIADVEVPGLDGALIGRRVGARVPVGSRAALVIPRDLVATRFGVDFVRVVGANNRATDTPVQIAPGPDPRTVEVLSGLKAGDRLARPEAAR